MVVYTGEVMYCVFAYLSNIIFNLQDEDILVLTKDLYDLLCFNATFSNISAISWRQVLVVEEAGVPGENHRPWASNW
jgi:hypothetical protein